MRMIHRQGWVVALATVGLLVTALATANGATASPLIHRMDPGGVRKFWTEDRMARAIPLDVPRAQLDDPGRPSDPGIAQRRKPPKYISQPVPKPGAQPFRTAGKVYLQFGKRLYVCSASVVKAPSRSLVWTAGHCLRDPGPRGKFAKRWVFVPDYDQGSAPLGGFAAKKLAVTRGWASGNQHYDFGAAILAPTKGKRVQRAVGAALPFGANSKYRQSWLAIGYPEAKRWGQNMWFCASRFYRRDRRLPGPGPDTVGIGCNMNGGASGGPWITGNGRLGAVSAYIYRKGPDALYGTYLGSAAKKLYKRVRRKH